ncbi:MAG: hypothetical protein K0B11_03855 [Mariniphaga sp.]|nr:hypothetical protein [Mariniphaga sp.]
MATVIKCKIDGISKPLELQGGLSFGYNSNANVSNASNDKKITFGPVSVTPFSFSVAEPDKESVKALIEWLVSHKIKKNATFEISDQDAAAKPREISLEQVCLESYNESVSEYGSQISLSIVGQKVTIDGISLDQTAQR